MTWIKLDDNAVDHPKVASLTDKAFRWWVRGLSYSSRYLTDGSLPKVFWKQAPNGVRSELVSSRLWDWIDPHFLIHDYHHHQSTREDVEYEKTRNRAKAAAYRAKKRGLVSGVTGDVTGDVTGTSPEGGYQLVPNPENREHIHITENREQTTATPSAPLRPLISGEANPKTWGKIHGDHVAGFCDWVCLPEFVFAECVRKSAGADYVRQWAAGVRAKFEGQTVGDNLKFWRARWSDTHPEVAVNGGKPIPKTAAEIIAELDARDKARAVRS